MIESCGNVRYMSTRELTKRVVVEAECTRNEFTRPRQRSHHQTMPLFLVAIASVQTKLTTTRGQISLCRRLQRRASQNCHLKRRPRHTIRRVSAARLLFCQLLRDSEAFEKRARCSLHSASKSDTKHSNFWSKCWIHFFVETVCLGQCAPR